MERAVLAHPAKLWLHQYRSRRGQRDGTKMARETITVPLVESQQHVINPTNPGRALDDGVEDRLHVCRRAADDAQHFGGAV